LSVLCPRWLTKALPHHVDNVTYFCTSHLFIHHAQYPSFVSSHLSFVPTVSMYAALPSSHVLESLPHFIPTLTHQVVSLDLYKLVSAVVSSSHFTSTIRTALCSRSCRCRRHHHRHQHQHQHNPHGQCMQHSTILPNIIATDISTTIASRISSVPLQQSYPRSNPILLTWQSQQDPVYDSSYDRRRRHGQSVMVNSLSPSQTYRLFSFRVSQAG
jgi:branched-subunit amino acid transport protein